jgi:putative membrane-bound dehydrogenase-like protein
VLRHSKNFHSARSNGNVSCWLISPTATVARVAEADDIAFHQIRLGHVLILHEWALQRVSFVQAWPWALGKKSHQQCAKKQRRSQSAEVKVIIGGRRVGAFEQILVSAAGDQLSPLEEFLVHSKSKAGFWFVLIVAVVSGAVALTRPALSAAEGTQQSGNDDVPAPRRVKVLFLGDTGHHDPLVRCRQIYSVLAKRGVDLTYSQNLDDLTAENLDRFDVLLLYANWTSIKPPQEKALIDYVESGHGFAPIHCGSYCFLNSRKITDIIGGRFKSHRTGTFSETIAMPDHPIERGLNPIESWDETYVHEMHNEKDRTVLGYRIEGDHKEPYTWVRTQGKGRVFYTAWGHDQRTWGNVDFQNLLERGIRWAAGDWAMSPQPSLKPYAFSEANLPNYLPGRAWGTIGEPISKMQDPISPRESMKHMALAGGFSPHLVVAEPAVKKPIAMAFDERGRLWVAETFDYPNNMQPRFQGHDQISIVEDANSGQEAKKVTTFATGLSIPTSLVIANGGVIVAQPPDMLFLKDSTGSGHADVKKVLFTGFGTRDTHASVSNLHYGFDNWIYGTVGYSGFTGTVGGKEITFGQGVFRFKPDGSKLEFLGSTTNNTWGMCFTEDGQLFGSTANANPAWYMSIPNRYYEQVRGMSPPRLEPIADTWHFYPQTEKVRQVDQFGGYTAGAGSEIYTARTLPKEYWNRISFVTEPTGHLVGQFVLEPKGSGYVARNDFNLLTSDDEWTAPIAASVGPDGQVWMIDWYNIVVQHNPIPRGFAAGKGGAYESALRDKTHGRIYRLVYNAGKPSKVLDLSKASTDQLVEALKSDNMLWRMHAQRLLVEHGDASAIGGLIKLTQDSSVDEIGLSPAAIHALWAMHGLGALDGSHADATAAAVAALHHPSAAVRKAALDVLPRDANSAVAIGAARSIEDHDAQVRKSALLALSEMPGTNETGRAIFAVLNRPENVNDAAINDAAAIAAARDDAGFLQAAFAAHPAQSASDSSARDTTNLVPNPSFEIAQGTRPARWTVRTYSGSAVAALERSGHTGQRSLSISSETGADTSMSIDVPVDPYTDYRLSGWIRTEDLKGAMGALLNVHLTDARTAAINGTNDWKQVQVTFNSGDRKTVSINCLFGGWGPAIGSAWYDDIELTPLQSSGLPKNEGRVVRVVMDQYTQRAPVESVVPTLVAARGTSPALAFIVINSLAANWPQGITPKLADTDVAALKDVMKALPITVKDRLISLAAKWGRTDLFADEQKALVKQFRDDAANGSLEGAKRADAARRLIAIDDTADSTSVLLKQITPAAAPDLQLGMLEALSESHGDTVGQSLVSRWDQLTPTAQRAALNLMLRRSSWTGALLSGIESGKINNKDLQPQQWQALTSNIDGQIASKARELFQRSGGAVNSDRQAIVDKMMPAAAKHGDAVRGQQLFEKNCAVCHTIEGKGGQIGPDLTGMGARARAENLIDIVDPNRSVEGTYKQWTVKTKDDVISGRLLTESQTSIELVDAAAKHYTIQRSDIQLLKGTDRSLMPEGFEQLGEDGLADLLEYIGTSKVKR